MATKAELLEEATAAGLEVSDKMTKAEIEEALSGSSTSSADGGFLDRLIEPGSNDAKPTPTVEAGKIDPRLETIRDAQIEAEGDTPPVRRPVAARIDPRLVEIRTATIDEEARSVTSARTAPDRG